MEGTCGQDRDSGRSLYCHFSLLPLKDFFPPLSIKKQKGAKIYVKQEVGIKKGKEPREIGRGHTSGKNEAYERIG